MFLRIESFYCKKTQILRFLLILEYILKIKLVRYLIYKK